MFLLLINLAAGSVAATIYGISAYRWALRRRILLAAINAAVCGAALVFAIGYGVIIVQEHYTPLVQATAFRPLVSLVLLLPAIARWTELRADEKREAYARALAKKLG